MMEVFKIKGPDGQWHDFSGKIQRKGISWSRDDLDGEESGRTMDGVMHRAKVAVKRNMSFKLMKMSREDLAYLDDCLSQETFTLRYFDLHGSMEKEFYCSQLKATFVDVGDGINGTWADGEFNIHEI